jgi:sec-independent protein translocase protein TatC
VDNNQASKAAEENLSEDELIAGGKVMSLMEHLQDLRGTLVRSGTVVMILFFVCMFFATNIIDFLKQPLLRVLPEGSGGLHFTGPLDVFSASIQVSMLTAIVFSCPYWLYQFWKFFEPGLYPKERKYILPFIAMSVGLFTFGVCFCFFFMLPLSLEFLIGLGTQVGTPIITINDYISLVMILIFATGLVFETPIILILLAMLDLISVDQLTSSRRMVIVIILIVAAVLTPPDPVSQVSMAVPMYIMYEFAIIVIKLMNRRKSKTDALTVT